MSQKPRRHTTAIVILTLLILAMIAATGFVIWLCIDLASAKPTQPTPESPSIHLPTDASSPAPVQTQPPETTVPPEPVPESVISTATISVQGDLLMHKPVFVTCVKDGKYNFESIFRYCQDLVSSFDYAIANLETTFGGDNYPYQGNPEFNCPDPLAQNVKEAGYDMLLTANNHAADTRADGIIRTVEVVRDAGLTNLGTQLNDEELKYAIVDVNGIKIGMVSYTYAYSHENGKFSLNGLAPIPDVGCVNFFMNNNLNKLYTEVEQIMAQMKEDGAEATMIFFHWGAEYQLKQNKTQDAIAQKMCDMGFDVIVGGHPHVVQPMALLESTVDSSHKTVVIYSLGNAVSNQRTGYISNAPDGYTEDGALFTVTFEKYSDGKVYVADTDVIPTWVNMHTTGGVKEYNILPLQDSRRSEWRSLYNLNDNTMGFCEKSYARTMGIVGEGLEACRSYLSQAKIDREAMYLDMAVNPGNYENLPSAA